MMRMPPVGVPTRDVVITDYHEFVTKSLGDKVMLYSNAKKGNRRCYYYDAIAAFDIESTSYVYNGEKTAWMYEWTFGINGYITYGRTWEQFLDCLSILKEHIQLKENRRFAIYVHNFSFEFQFLRKLFRWTDTFSTKAHVPIRCVTQEGWEFRCSYQVAGLRLQGLNVRDDHVLTSMPNLPPQYVMHKTHDLDYSLVRHQLTPLSAEELNYCFLDVRVLMYYLKDKANDNQDHVAMIPLTRTGYVRRDVRRHTVDGPNGKAYKEKMRTLRLTEHDYEKIRAAFMGGFTHSNASWTGLTIRDVTSMDLTSSYPTVMVAYKYPMSPYRAYTPKDEADFRRCLDKYQCIFDLELFDVNPKLLQESPIPLSKCHNAYEIESDPDTIINNGRVYCAKHVVITVSHVDFKVISKFYTFSSYNVSDFYVADSGYLPKEYVETVLKYYGLKTTLKNVPGDEVQYALYKEYVNGLYGMTATNIVREINHYLQDAEDGDEWLTEKGSTEDIEKENRNPRRFLFFGWSYMVTAYARYRLFEAIEELGDDYIYSDTDSVKFVNYADHKDWFNQKNQEIINELTAACNAQGIDPALIAPKNTKGKPCPLGIWDYDGHYRRFKTLGAKRYMYESLDPIYLDEYDDDGPTGNKIIGAYEYRIHTTVAGVSKSTLPKYLTSLPGDPFDNFNETLYVPPEYTGKLAHTYCTRELTMDITDYMGITATVHTYGGVHLEPMDYTMHVSDEYIEFFTELNERHEMC